MLLRPIRLLEYIFLIKQRISWVSLWCMRKKYLVKMFFCEFSHTNNKYSYGIYYRTNRTTFVQLWHNAIDEWYRLLRQFVIFGEINDKKMSNLMILDYSGRLCTNVVIRVWFTCLLKNSPKSPSSGNTRYTSWLQRGHVNVVQKPKCDHRENTF